MNGNIGLGGWLPVGWTPVLYSGTPWQFAAAFTGEPDITGGVLVVNGRDYPINATPESVTFTVAPVDVDTIPNHAPASLFLDTESYGRFLWLNGSVVRR